MPRKKGELPRPCPLCGRTDGTYQYVVFNHKYRSSRNAVICRIGHYDRNFYESKKREIRTTGKKPTGRIWHSFKAAAPFNITHEGKTMDPSKYFDEFPQESWWQASHTSKPQAFISDYIKKWGWQMYEEKSLQIKRRKVKEYFSPKKANEMLKQRTS